METAAELHRAGLDALVGRRIAVARRLLDRARERSDDPELTARIDASRAYLHAEQGELDRAIELCTEALDLAGLSPSTSGVLHSQLALIQFRNGDLPAALTSFGIGITRLTDPLELGKALSNRGGVHLTQGSGPLAADDFAEAAQLFGESGRPVEAAMAEHNLGCADLLRGDLVSALAHMDAVRPTLVPLSPVGGAITNQDRAEVLLAAGLTRGAMTLLDEAARIYGQHRMRQRRGEAELTIARAALALDPERALVSARAARSRFSRAGSPALRVRAEALVLGAEVRLRRSGPSLVTRADALAEELGELGLPWWAVDARLDAALVVLRRGDLDGAAGRLRAIKVSAGAPLDVRLRDRDVRAALAERTGRRSVALSHVRRGLTELHQWQSSFGSLDLQTMVTGHGVRLAQRGLRIAVASGSAEVLFEWSERARVLASRVQPVRLPAGDEVVADLGELRTLAAEEAPSRESRQRAAELRDRVRQQRWQHRGSGRYDEPVAPAEVSGALGPGTALVAHVVSTEAMAAVVVTDRGATVHDLGGREPLDALVGGLLPDLDMAAAELPGPFAETVRGELRNRLGRLDALLLPPAVREALGDRELVLTPSGVLATVPWSMLPSIGHRPVTVAQSATSWLARTADPLRTGSAGFVAGPRVAQAQAEIEAAQSVWDGSRALSGPAATAAAVSELAGRVDVLHVSAHGRHSSENPLFSGFELADGPWFGYDIDQLGGVPDVVLLSACEVGRSTLRGGQELIGMTAAWLHAGSRCVIASASAINDGVAHDVLVGVHRGLAAGRPPAAALADAVAALDPEGPPAPLVAFG